MIYEIYIDTLFLLNFGLNLYLLELTNSILHHAATWRRVLVGALSGSIVSVIPFLFPGSFAIAYLCGFICSVLCMCMVTFRIPGIKDYLYVLEIISALTVLLGTCLVYILRKLPETLHLPLVIVFIAGAVCFLVIRGVMKHKNSRSHECKAILQCGTTKIKVNALVDTGNGLVEPISGSPVAVLDKSVFDRLFFEEKPAGFRAIPYRTIDKKAGILPGYLIPEVWVEWKGCSRVFRNVYVGVQKREMKEGDHYKMIINPDMLKERRKIS